MLKNLTGIRGIAALWVFGMHYKEYFVGLFPEFSRLGFILDNGKFGVDLFFCLSGFIIGYVYFDELKSDFNIRKLKIYLYKRFARLYPIYLASLLMATLFYLIAIVSKHQFNHESPENLSITGFLLNLFGVQSWFGVNSLNGPAWSVSAEFAAYLFFPLLVLLLQRSSKNGRILDFVVLFASILIYEIAILTKPIINQQIVQVLTEFTMGFCTFLFVRTRTISKIKCLVSRNLVLFAIIASLIFISSEAILSAVVPVLLLVLVGLNFFYNENQNGLSRPSLVRLGLWSYSLYMTHRLLQNVMSGLSLPQYSRSLVVRLLELGLLLLLPLSTAYIFTKCLENPARKYLLNFLN